MNTNQLRKPCVIGVLAAVAVALPLGGAASAHGVHNPKRATRARTLAVFQHRASKREVSAPEGLKGVLVRFGVSASTPLTPALVYSGAHPVTVYTFAKPGYGCAALSKGGIGGCVDKLLEADGLLSIHVSIVDGGTYVWGLAADGVTGVSVSEPGSSIDAKVSNNTFLAEIPDGSMGTPAISVAAETASAGSHVTEVPGIPAPHTS